MHILTVRLILGFLNNVGPEVKTNEKARNCLKQTTQAIVIVCNILFLSQLHREFRRKLKIVLVYVSLMLLAQIGNTVDF
jgi:cell division protein FtsW (lipid II flippase)